MPISLDDVKELREMTGVSIMQCRKALEEAKGDKEKALIILRKLSSAAAAKKSDRNLGAGAVASYIHNTGTVGTLVELLCETDFVGKNEEFIALARNIAMHAAATAPQYVTAKDISDEERQKVREALAESEDVKSKPANIQEKILTGKLDTYFKEKTLAEQPFIKDPNITVQELVAQAVQKFGERIELGRLSRFSI